VRPAQLAKGEVHRATVTGQWQLEDSRVVELSLVSTTGLSIDLALVLALPRIQRGMLDTPTPERWVGQVTPRPLMIVVWDLGDQGSE